MNKRIILLVSFFLLGLGSFLSAQTNKDTLLCRTWKISFTETYNLMTTSARQIFDNMPETKRNNIKNRLEAQRFIFSFGGVVTSMQGNDSNVGTWEWLDNQTKIYMTIDGRNATRVLQTISNNVLIWDMDNNASVGLFPQLYLIPSN